MAIQILSIKEWHRRLAKAAKIFAPNSHEEGWNFFDLDEFTGGFDYAIAENGNLELQVTKGSSPVIIPPPDSIAKSIITSLKSGEFRLASTQPGGFYSEKERESVLALPEDEQKARVLNDYNERCHKPYMEYLQTTFGKGATPAAAPVIAITQGSNSRVSVPNPRL